jgi:hypothetical protein
MTSLKDYLCFYEFSSEAHLFRKVNGNFRKNCCLTAEEFFAVIIWKSNRSKTRIRDGILRSGKSIPQITQGMHLAAGSERKMEALLAIDGVGIPIASAVLTVCYPDEFTVVDYRARAAIAALWPAKTKSIAPDPTQYVKGYLRYVAICREIANEQGMCLRDIDRALWGYDFCEGKNGLKALVASVEASG